MPEFIIGVVVGQIGLLIAIAFGYVISGGKHKG